MLSTSSVSLSLTLGLLTHLLPTVDAHGFISGVVANGQYNQGPNIYRADDPVNAQTAIREMYDSASPSYLKYWDFNDNNKMGCEESGPAPTSIKISAGSPLQIIWTGATSDLLNKPGTGNTQGRNPFVHAMGSVSDYIASCNGPCSNFDASNGDWVKLAQWGLDSSEWVSEELRNTMEGKPEPYYPQGEGLWGIAKLVQDSSVWTVYVPSGLKNGQYIIRNELAALHSPKSSGGGPQLYVGCIQIEVIDGGCESLPAGTKAGSLYGSDGYLANYDVYSSDFFDDSQAGPARAWNMDRSSCTYNYGYDSAPFQASSSSSVRLFWKNAQSPLFGQLSPPSFSIKRPSFPFQKTQD
ncbi:hypothetical protein D9758_018255 [Tetrapyrgos nigripes]|uniref:lytic cellulose monooxygenase (C4-dehydrogenating) n=1 Tax=Tetrapyrgos nigripes TaxID=182062 RepID=A0A8H5BUZ3_9AGAR|nr:hypothetical protein D9758_018255 [Tetrapyrgos nigripes]